MHQDDSILESSGLQDTHPSELASNTTDQSHLRSSTLEPPVHLLFVFNTLLALILTHCPTQVETNSVDTTILLVKQLHAEKAKLIKINATDIERAFQFVAEV